MSASEAQALFLLVGPAAAVAPEAKAALRKLVRALPDTFRADAEAAAEAVVIDPARWGEHVKERPEMVRRLQEAVVRRVQVRLQYAGRGREVSERLISPLGLVDKDDIWYLIAGTEKGQRTFRVERIVEAELTDLPAERPADFDLATAWTRVVDEMERNRSLLTATVVMEERFLWVMQDRLGRHCEVIGAAGEGRVKIEVTAPSPLMIAQHLAGWGALIEVLTPPSVQTELARLGQELVDRYRPPAPAAGRSHPRRTPPSPGSPPPS